MYGVLWFDHSIVDEKFEKYTIFYNLVYILKASINHFNRKMIMSVIILIVLSNSNLVINKNKINIIFYIWY